MQKFGGAATDSVHNGTNYSYWTRGVFSTPSIVEVWACLDGGHLGAALETWRVALWKVLGDARDGYLAYMGGGIGKEIAIRRYTGGSFTDIAQVGADYPERLGLRIDGANVECWSSLGGVWALRCSAVDNTHRGGFYLSIGIEDPTAGGLSMPCFGGGVRNRSQIFRLLRN